MCHYEVTFNGWLISISMIFEMKILNSVVRFIFFIEFTAASCQFIGMLVQWLVAWYKIALSPCLGSREVLAPISTFPFFEMFLLEFFEKFHNTVERTAGFRTNPCELESKSAPFFSLFCCDFENHFYLLVQSKILLIVELTLPKENLQLSSGCFLFSRQFQRHGDFLRLL